MARFANIGNKIINLDLITHVDFNGEQTGAVVQIRYGITRIEFRGKVALEVWDKLTAELKPEMWPDFSSKVAPAVEEV